MLNRLRSKQLGKRMGKYKIIFMQFLIVCLALSFAACSMFEGLVGTKPKVEAPPPKPAEAPPVASKPEAPLTPSTAPAVSAPKQAPSPGTPTAPPTEPKKEEVKPAPPPAPTEVYVITLKNANVRKETNPKSKIITTLKKGTKVEKIGQSGNWVNVQLPSGESGHIFHELVKEVE
jgi:uncharacterized protein YgiM (DUF1202 family)